MPAPANDNFSSAQVVSGASGSYGPVTIDAATTEASEPHGTAVTHGIHQSIWFSWTPTGDGVVVFDTSASLATDGNGDGFGGLDTTMTAWTGTTLTGLTQVASNDDVDGTHYTSRVSFTAVGGTTYLIQVGTYGTPYTGTVELAWSQTVSAALTVSFSSVVAAQHFSSGASVLKWVPPAAQPGFTDTITATGSASAGDLFIGVVVSGWSVDATSTPTGHLALRQMDDPTSFAAGPGNGNTYITQQIGSNYNDTVDPWIQGTEVTQLNAAIAPGDTITATWTNSDTGVNGDHTVGGRTYLLVAFRISPTMENMTFDSNFFGPGGTHDMLNDGENDDGHNTGSAAAATILSGDRDTTTASAFPRDRDGDLLAVTAWSDGSKTFGSVSSPWASIAQTAVAGQYGVDIHARTFLSGTATYSISGTLSGSTSWRSIIAAWAASAVVAGSGFYSWQRL